jgi:hypothetical protein
MILTKATFKRMCDLFAVTIAVPLWDDGEPWYLGVLTAPYTPGPDFEDIPPGGQPGDILSLHYASSLPTTFICGYLANTNTVRVAAVGDDIGDSIRLAQGDAAGFTIYGYYLYYSSFLDVSWAATIPLETPIGPLLENDFIHLPPIEFTFNPEMQI